MVPAPSQHTDQRPLSARLEALFSFDNPAAAVQPHPVSEHDAMRAPRPLTLLPAQNGIPKPSLKPRQLQLSPLDMPSRPSSTQPSPQRSPLPILRWLGRQPSPSSASTSGSPPTSRSSSPISALRDALSSTLPTPPPAAHQSQHSPSSRTRTNHPPT
ncbi:hypothetical protein EW146_g10153, partial [Bondarzewia mesenterica]